MKAYHSYASSRILWSGHLEKKEPQGGVEKQLHHPSTELTAGKPLSKRAISPSLLKKPDGYQHQGAEYKITLFKKFLANDTAGFTESDWLYLIVKMGKRVMAPEKRQHLEAQFSAEDLPRVLKKRAELQWLRYELENIVFHSRWNTRMQLHEGSVVDPQLFSDQQLLSVVARAKEGKTLCDQVPVQQLYSADPPQDVRHNPFFSSLIIACHRNSQFNPPEVSTGRVIEQVISGQIAGQHHEKPRDVEKVRQLLLSSKEKTVCGGRTVQVTDETGKTYYLKFLRKNEPWDEFIREAAMHGALNMPAFKAGLTSEIPRSEHLFSVPVWYLDQQIVFEDPLACSADPEVGLCYQGYCFSASPHYVAYACQVDPECPEDPLSTSVEGLKKAARDLGVHARRGIIFDSLIKAQHTVGDQKAWTTLANIGDRLEKNADPFPGAICDWVAQTKRSDLAWSGLRDLGDSQFIEHIDQNLKPDSPFKKHFPEPVRKQLAFCSTLMDNVVAIAIIYSRGKRMFTDYHYHNPEAIKQVGQFVHDVLYRFLSGYLSRDDVRIDQMMNISPEEYQKWLGRTATEIIYWTAIQPGEERSDAFHQSEYPHDRENYSTHTKRQRLLDQYLYPEQSEKISYFNLNDGKTKNFSLGLNHCFGFPFVALIKGMTKMLTDIVNTQSQ